MKKQFIYYTLGILIFFSYSCQNKLENEIRELKQELNAQRELIELLQNNNNTVSNISYTENGYTITLSDNSTIVLTYTTPIIVKGDKGNWLLNGKDTGIQVKDDKQMPDITIGENGNWFIDGNDTNIKAENPTNGLINIVLIGKELTFFFSDGSQIQITLDGFAEKSENDICLPKYMYMLSDTRNYLYFEPFIRRWQPTIDIVRISSTIPLAEQNTRYICIDQPKAWQTISANLYDQDFNIVKSQTSIVRLGEKNVGDKEVRVQIIGDSYVQGAFFKDALLTQGYVPNIKLIGLRKIDGTEGQYDEGRGGDRLQDYFSVHTGETKAYHGFMHPDGDYRYYGSTAFWMNCHKAMNGDTGLTYTCGRFDDFAIRFNAETGYLLTPRQGDMQYDNTLKSFVLYDKGTWKAVKKEDFTWSFDYGKYIEAWNLPAPHFLGELLGLNDFRNDMNADFTTWNEQIQIMKQSYLDAVPDGKFMILIPCSTCGIMNNVNGEFTLQQNAAMWKLRKNIIDTFDNREDEGFYLVDVGSTIDNENGYNKDENGMQTGNPHPYLSYPVMGIPIAAFIQFHREK